MKQPEKDCIDDLVLRVSNLEKHSYSERYLTQSIKELQAGMRRVENTIKGPHYSLGKRILIGLSIAFLSACTIRYWLDKIETLYSKPYSAIEDQLRRSP
jgi:hypothetical protein